jgi:PAS domain S-box-containing protein
LSGGAFAMGGGIWSMHYIGMLAFQLTVPVFYDLPLVALSLLAAMLSSAAALYVVSRDTMRIPALATGSIVMGAGIAAMHYIGMAAMRLPATSRWNVGIVATSVVIAVVVSCVALWLAFRLRSEERLLAPRKLASAALMGAAIACMHYTGMAAAEFHMAPMRADTTHAVSVSALGVAGISVVTFLVLTLALLTSVMDRRITSQNLVFLEGEARHRQLIERSLAGIYWCSLDGHIVDCNEACARILGFDSRDALLSADASELHVDMATRDRFIADLLATGRVPDFESQLRRRDGSPVWVLENATLLEQHAGTRLIEGTMLDITARRRAEDELRGTEQRLRAEIKERERIEVALLLKQRLESVGQLAAGIAHEINTPVQFVSDSVHFVRDVVTDYATLIAAYQQVVDAVLADAPAAELAALARASESAIDLTYLLDNSPRAIDRAIEGLDRIATIVRSMKEFAHPDQQEMSQLDFNRAVLTTLEVARNEYKYVADIHTELGELPLVKCYAGEINQVVLNLVVNAAHAIADAGTATRARGLITIGTHLEANDVVLEITDTGCGIPDEIRERIFDPFFTTKEVGRGTGQGLAISRSIVVDKHAGSLAVTSVVGEGSRFVVRLPVLGRELAA